MGSGNGKDKNYDPQVEKTGCVEIVDTQWRHVRGIHIWISTFGVILIIYILTLFCLIGYAMYKISINGESFTPYNIMSYTKYVSPATYTLPQNPKSMMIKN